MYLLAFNSFHIEGKISRSSNKLSFGTYLFWFSEKKMRIYMLNMMQIVPFSCILFIRFKDFSPFPPHQFPRATIDVRVVEAGGVSILCHP